MASLFSQAMKNSVLIFVLQDVWNVCLQTSWWNPQDLSHWCLRKFLKSLSPVNRCQVGKLMLQNLSFQIPSQLQWKIQGSFVKFDKETNHIHTFRWQFFLDTNEFIMLWKVLKMLMILFHGQSTTERGFSVYGKLLVENLHTKSLIAQRHSQSHGKLWFAGFMIWILHMNYWTLSVLQENIFSRVRKRDHWQKKN